MQDKIEQVSNLATKAGATIAVTPGAAKLLSMEWWNENSAGVVAICAVIGATISILGFIVNQWHKGSIQRLFRRLFARSK